MNKNIQQLALGSIFALACTLNMNAQVVSQKVGTNPTIITPSTAFEVESANKGVLLPRVALTSATDATTILAPTTSMLVYNTATAGTSPNNVTPGYYYWTGTAWTRLTNGTPSADWTLTGNAGTVASTNFIGTTDAIDFVTRTNNTERMRINTNGRVGIGVVPNDGSEARLQVNSNYSKTDVTRRNLAILGSNDAANPISLFFQQGGGASTASRYMSLEATENGIATIPLVLQPSIEGNVGIGTTTPITKLDVSSENLQLGSYNRLLKIGRPNDEVLGGSIGSRALDADQRQGLMIRSNQTITLQGDFSNDNVGGVLDVLGGKNASISDDSNLFFRIMHDGNVGINTSTPSTKLHVNSTTAGAIRIVDGTQGAGKVLTSDANGVGTWKIAQSGKVMYKFAPTQTWVTDRSSRSVIRFQTAVSDAASYYNPSTGIFTAPVDAVYTFDAKIHLACTTGWTIINMELENTSTGERIRILEIPGLLTTTNVCMVNGIGSIKLNAGQTCKLTIDAQKTTTTFSFADYNSAPITSSLMINY